MKVIDFFRAKKILHGAHEGQFKVAELTQDQKKMKDVLNAKGKMIVDSLLEHLGPKNQNDIHKALNASTVLLEFVDNPNCSPIITNAETLKKLVQICC